MRMVEASGAALHMREDGDPAGKPVVFSNSFGTDLRPWNAIMPHLPAGLRIIRDDTRGHGLSDCPQGSYALGDLGADAEALLEALDVRKCVFVGFSIGTRSETIPAVGHPPCVEAPETHANLPTQFLKEIGHV